MRTIDRDLDRILIRLRNAIRERGFTQLEVQQTLGWGRSYVSRLLTKQKALRIDQILMILNVIDVTPEDFWGKIYPFDGPTTTARRRRARRATASSLAGEASTLTVELRRMERLVERIVIALKNRHLITGPDLADAIARARSGRVVLPTDSP